MIPNASPLGCYNTKVIIDSLPSSKFRRFLSNSTNCSCSSPRFNSSLSLVGYQPLNGSRAGICWCFGMLPFPLKERDEFCSKRNTSILPLFYTGTNSKNSRCRFENVRFDNLRIAYNPHRLLKSSDSSQITLFMHGDGSGTRITVPNDFLYGIFQVDAIVSNTVGVVSAFYLRSDYHQETKDFSEIDVEFLNGRPGVPDGVWLNSFNKGISNGETLLTPSRYQTILNTSVKDIVSKKWTTYTIDWTKNSVTWNMNGTTVKLRKNNQINRWKDMNGVSKQISFNSPTKHSHVTFSIWTAGGSFSGFGGMIPPSQQNKIFQSRFTKHRRIVCV